MDWREYISSMSQRLRVWVKPSLVLVKCGVKTIISTTLRLFYNVEYTELLHDALLIGVSFEYIDILFFLRGFYSFLNKTWSQALFGFYEVFLPSPGNALNQIKAKLKVLSMRTDLNHFASVRPGRPTVSMLPSSVVREVTYLSVIQGSWFITVHSW